MLYPIYSGIDCPVCGSRDHNKDCGPYEVVQPENYADHGCPEVHLIVCLNCHKEFDAGPPRAAARWQALIDGYPA